MIRPKTALIVGALLLFVTCVGWFARRSKQDGERALPTATKPFTALGKTDDLTARALNLIAAAKAGQVTPREIVTQLEVLRNGGGDSRALLGRTLRSGNDYERLLAFRLLLEINGWSSELSAHALGDSFALLRVEAADWLYLAGRFREWNSFLSLAAKTATADSLALRSSVQHSNWPDLPAGLEMLGVGKGIDRYFTEVLRRSDPAALQLADDLFSAAVSPEEQQAKLRLLHAANRADYEALLRKLLLRSSEDTPVRYEAIWLLGQVFASPANREILAQHLAANATDPSRSRVEQVLASVSEQLASGGDRITWLESRLSAATKSGSRADYGPALVGYLVEALRTLRVSDKALLAEAKRVLPSTGLDYVARRRLADIDYLLSRTP
jgi:hypothetical protein